MFTFQLNKFISGGSTSLIFYLKAINCKPEELIVRFHYANDEETNVHDLKFIGESGENLVFHILSKLNFGPKIYSIFNGGRIEEYIPVSLKEINPIIFKLFLRSKLDLS